MLPIPKVYKVDYDFLIKNYLDPSLWKKTWTIYVYKDNIFTISLNSIYCASRDINFKISYNKLQPWGSEVVTYPLDGQMSINILMKKINGTIWNLMCNHENDLIVQSDGYKRIESQISEEEDILREIAEEFLDDNNVTNDSIREAYIDTYVDDNSKIHTMLANYVTGCRYTFLTEDMLIFTKATDDKARFDTVVRANSSNTIDEIMAYVTEEMAKWEDENIDNTRREYYANCEAI
jgi:hypothetical protein